MKKVVALLLTLGMLLTMLAGCGSTNNDAGGGKEDAGGTDGVIEVTFWHVLGGSLQEPVENLVKEFNETVGAENKIHVTPVYQGTDIMTVLTPVVQTDDVANMPDVANISFSSTMDMSNCEYVRWLEDLMAEDDTCSAQDYLANGAYSVSVNGRMAAAPFSVSAMILYYNKNMFRDAGLDPEAPPKTIAELADYTEKLTTYNRDGSVDVYGFACTPDRWHLSNWIGGMGGHLGNNEGGRTGSFTEVVFGKEGTLEKVLTEYDKVVQTGGVQNAAADQRAEFLAGDYAMILQSSSRISSFMAAAKEGGWELGVAGLPAVDAQATEGEAAGGAALYIFDRKDEARVQATYTFVKWMTSPEVQARWSMSTGYVPTNVASQETEVWKDYIEQTPEAMVPLTILQNSSMSNQEPLDPISNQLSGYYADAFNALFAGESIPDIVENTVSKCNSAIDEYYEMNPDALW